MIRTSLCAALLERQMNSLVQEHVVFVVAVQDDDPLRPVPNKGLEDVADEPDHRRSAEARGAREDLAAAALGRRAVAIIDGRSHDCAELLGDEDRGVLDLDRIGAERQVRSVLLGRAHRQDQNRLADARHVLRPRKLAHQHVGRSINHLFLPNLPITHWPMPALIASWDPFVCSGRGARIAQTMNNRPCDLACPLSHAGSFIPP